MLPSQRDAKAASEYLKSLSSWLELDYFRRPRRLERIRRFATWSVLLLATALIAGLTWLPGNRQIYQADSVSTAARPVQRGLPGLSRRQVRDRQATAGVGTIPYGR